MENRSDKLVGVVIREGFCHLQVMLFTKLQHISGGMHRIFDLPDLDKAGFITKVLWYYKVYPRLR